MSNKKEDILKFLKQFGRMPTSKIGVLVGCDSKSVLKYLEELLEEDKVIKEEETNAMYWKIKI